MLRSFVPWNSVWLRFMHGTRSVQQTAHDAGDSHTRSVSDRGMMQALNKRARGKLSAIRLAIQGAMCEEACALELSGLHALLRPLVATELLRSALSGRQCFAALAAAKLNARYAACSMHTSLHVRLTCVLWHRRKGLK